MYTSQGVLFSTPCTSAEQLNADLIIMGAGQRNIVDRILLGSTAHGVLNNTPCDVYIARG